VTLDFSQRLVEDFPRGISLLDRQDERRREAG
jgi:hypothetical protein